MGFWYRTKADGSWELSNEDDGTTAFGLSAQGKPFFNYPAHKAVLFDDFLGDLLADEWSVNSGSDAQAADPVINQQEGGACRLVTGNLDGTFAADGSALGHGLNWSADQGGLIFECRLKIVTAVTTVSVNCGFTDVLPASTLEEPFGIGASDAITSTASNAVCWVFDTGAATDEWHGVGVKANTDTALLSPGIVPVADTYQTFRIELDTSGNATFFIDGVKHGTLANAVTATTLLTPIVTACSTTTTSRTVDVDYIFVTQNR